MVLYICSEPQNKKQEKQKPQNCSNLQYGNQLRGTGVTLEQTFLDWKGYGSSRRYLDLSEKNKDTLSKVLVQQTTA